MTTKERPSSTNSAVNAGSIITGGSSNKITPREEKILGMMEKLKSKYKQKEEENKKLHEQLENLVNVTKKFEENYKTIQSLYSQVMEAVSKKTFETEKFSTSDNSALTKHIKGPEVSIYGNINVGTIIIAKKYEELEAHYNDMTKSFNLIVTKYKLLSEEKNRSEESRQQIENRYSQLEQQFEETYKQYVNKCDEMKRHKEIDKCLINYTLNSFMILDATRDDGNKKANSSDPSGIKCEPIPSFAKFLAKRK
jgi:chromosome segregation ATPase